MKAAPCLLPMVALSLSGRAAANTLPVVTNVTTASSGDTLLVSYDLFDPDGDPMPVLVGFAESEIRIDGPQEGVAGDVGRGIEAGKGTTMRLEGQSRWEDVGRSAS